MHELIEEYEKHTQQTRTEGETGVKNLCKLVNAMGYSDEFRFGSFEYNGSYGDLITFLEDNPGCIEAIKEWIGDQNIQDWKDNLEAHLPHKDEEDEV
jgi:hypothetical protein